MLTKPSLLLLHGALGSKNQFQSLKLILKDNFKIYELNFSGHGGEGFNPEGFGIQCFTNEVVRFLETQNLEKIPVFGYSMGGYVALNLAVKYPEKVDKIFTLGTKFDWSLQSVAKEVKMLNPQIIAEKVPRFAEVLKHRHKPNDWKNLVKKTAEMMIHLGNGGAIPEKVFSSIQNHVTIGIGGLDNMVSFEESKVVVELLQNGKLQYFEGFKHPFEQVDLEVLVKSLISFLDS